MNRSRLLRKFFQDVAAAALLGLACLCIVELINYVSSKMVRSPMQGMEDEVVDLSYRLRKKNDGHHQITKDDIVIIDIDDYSIQKLGHIQSWPRSYDARVVDYIASGHPKAIAFDVLYTESDSMGMGYREKLLANGVENIDAVADALRSDDELAQAIDSARCVYLSFFDDDSKISDSITSSTLSALQLIRIDNELERSMKHLTYPVLPINPFAKAVRSIGGMVISTSNDGIVRHYQLLQSLPSSSKVLAAVGNFPLYMMLDAKGIDADELTATPQGIMHHDSLLVPLKPDGTLRLNWLGTEDTIRVISYYKVLREISPAEYFEDKYVFLGTSASGLHDLKTVPSNKDKMSGVEVHATAFLNLMNGAYLNEPCARDVRLAFYGLAVAMILFFLILRPLFGVLAAFILFFAYRFAFEFWLLPVKQTIIPIAMLMTLTLVCYVASVLYSYFIRERRSRFLKSAFSSYVSPEIVDQIALDSAGLRLGGQKMELTVLFSDIRDFTYLSECYDSQQTVAFLNHYFSSMSDVIFEHQGTIDKFIGDAIMAIFGAPVPQKNHPEKACLVAVGMVSELNNVNVENIKLGFPNVSIGIGINTGDMTIGNIGSHKRFDYTVIGDAVNLGARLEGLTKFFDVQIIVSEYTRSAVDNPSLCFRELGNVIVKGKERPVKIYQLIAITEGVFQLSQWLTKWEEAFRFMEQKNLQSAMECMKDCQALNKEDLATDYYMKSCEAYLETPDAFDMLIRMDTK